VIVNEYSASNLSSFTDNYGRYEDWFELYNTSSSSVDLGGYYLSDNPNNLLKWQFPEGIMIQGQDHMKFYATGRDEISGNNYHTSFRLTQTKDDPEYIILSNPAGEIVDSVQMVITRKEHSRGRTVDGGETWGIYFTGTPGSSNNSATSYEKYAAIPVMSDTAGFYDGPITITITTTQPNSEIHYTTDGSKPISTSPVYSGPIDITETTIVKAVTICADPEVAYSLIAFHTYFIDDEHTMPIMSCSAGQLDNLLNGNQSLRPFGTFEYFNIEGERTNIGYGEYNEHGQDSWVHDQRSIDYISRDECGYNYAIREEMIPLTDRDEFQRVILRAAGDDNYPGIDTSAHLRDFFVQNTAQREGMFLDVRKGHKGLLYCNGVYWGIYGYREKVTDHDYTNYYYDQGKYDIYYLKLWGGSWAAYGGQAAWTDWDDLHDFIKYNDMSVTDNWEYVKTRLDYRSLSDYIHINSYVVCSDWINWNVGWWRGTNPEGEHKKWGYTLWDEDATFAHYINYTGVPGISPYTSPCYPEGLTSDPEQHIVMLNHLLDNEEFKTYHVNRYIDLYNSAFLPDRMIDYLTSIEEYMAPEMVNQVARWGGSVAQWENNVNKIKNFVTNRHSYLPSGLNSCYDLNGPYEVNLVVDPPQAGRIRINSMTLENASWGGNYFGGIETELEAIRISPNFEFSHWELYNHELSPSVFDETVTLEFESGDYITAVFEQIALTDSLVINEINYNADGDFDTEDWVEFYNPHMYPLDISGWEFKDSDDTHIFEFPENTIIEGNGYLVLSRDTATFTSFFPDVANVIGNMEFGLSSGGELIRVLDSTGVVIDTVHYDNNEPWPTDPDGGGPTLELKYWEYDNALPESWIASTEHGSPGEMNGYIVNIDPAGSVEPFSFTIYPNPLKNESILQVTSEKKMNNATMVLFNVFGQKARVESNLNGERLYIKKQDLQNGIYVCVLYDENNDILGKQKLMVE